LRKRGRSREEEILIYFRGKPGTSGKQKGCDQEPESLPQTFSLQFRVSKKQLIIAKEGKPVKRNFFLGQVGLCLISSFPAKDRVTFF
jgi:hypothetical protein